MKKLPLALSMLAFAGCQSPDRDHENYMRRVAINPGSFTIPKEKAQEAWARAQAWVAMWSNVKIETSTDSLIVTGQPSEGGGFGYRVTRMENDGGFLFSVRCLTTGESARVPASRNACILADYIKTGELPHPDLIQK